MILAKGSITDYVNKVKNGKIKQVESVPEEEN